MTNVASTLRANASRYQDFQLTVTAGQQSSDVHIAHHVVKQENLVRRMHLPTAALAMLHARWNAHGTCMGDHIAPGPPITP
jgi:hypothetical protein